MCVILGLKLTMVVNPNSTCILKNRGFVQYHVWTIPQMSDQYLIWTDIFFLFLILLIHSTMERWERMAICSLDEILGSCSTGSCGWSELFFLPTTSYRESPGQSRWWCMPLLITLHQISLQIDIHNHVASLSKKYYGKKLAQYLLLSLERVQSFDCNIWWYIVIILNLTQPYSRGSWRAYVVK